MTIKSSCILSVVLMVCSCAVAQGGEICVAGPVPTLIGTTCEIGSLEFTFNSFTSDQAHGTSFSAEDFTLTPVLNGFSIGFDGGPLSITSDGTGIEFAEAALTYTVSAIETTPGSNVVTGIGATGGSFWASPEGSSMAAYGNLLGALEAGYGCYTTVSPVFHCQESNGGESLMHSGNGTALIFSLLAEQSSVGWDGTPTTFAFDTGPCPTPEPGTSLLMLTWLSGYAVYRRKKANT